jgi:uncharacterized protein YndB with AHSA1/START domain
MGKSATPRLRMTGAVTRSVELPADADAVWLALTERDQLRRWFGADLVLDPRPGGDVRATWPSGDRSVGSVEAAIAPRHLVFRWRRIEGAGFAARVRSATRVEFVLEPTEVGTTVRVTEQPIELASLGGSG